MIACDRYVRLTDSAAAHLGLIAPCLRLAVTSGTIHRA